MWTIWHFLLALKYKKDLHWTWMTGGKINQSTAYVHVVSSERINRAIQLHISWRRGAARSGADAHRCGVQCLPRCCSGAATFYLHMLGSCLFRSSRLEFVEGSPLPVADVLWHVSGGTCTAYKAINQSSHSYPVVGRNPLVARRDVSQEARLYSRNNRENATTQKSLIDLVNCF